MKRMILVAMASLLVAAGSALAADCVGCHENPKEVPAARVQQAAFQEPATIRPWYGPARGFDFEREVQPVLNAYCVTCHNGDEQGMPDLRAEKHFPHYSGRELNRLGSQRLHPEVKAYFGGTTLRYTPAYEALLPYIRRVNVGDDVSILAPKKTTEWSIPFGFGFARNLGGSLLGIDIRYLLGLSDIFENSNIKNRSWQFTAKWAVPMGG